MCIIIYCIAGNIGIWRIGGFLVTPPILNQPILRQLPEKAWQSYRNRQIYIRQLQFFYIAIHQILFPPIYPAIRYVNDQGKLSPSQTLILLCHTHKHNSRVQTGTNGKLKKHNTRIYVPTITESTIMWIAYSSINEIVTLLWPYRELIMYSAVRYVHVYRVLMTFTIYHVLVG